MLILSGLHDQLNQTSEPTFVKYVIVCSLENINKLETSQTRFPTPFNLTSKFKVIVYYHNFPFPRLAKKIKVLKLKKGF